MEIIRHRINRIADLGSVDPRHGAELDLRSTSTSPSRLIVAHDPWQKGDDFGDWLKAANARGVSGTLIINTKEDGLEASCAHFLAEVGRERYFFLDTTAPTLVRWTREQNDPRFAVRYSRHEPIEAALAHAGHASWAWIDCFGGEPPDLADVERLKQHFRICLVSPELQIGLASDLKERVARFAAWRALADAVCTKTPDLWLGSAAAHLDGP